MGEMRNCKPKTGIVHLTATVCVIGPFLALYLVFLGSTMVPPLFILCLGKTWPSDTVVFVDDIVFDNFTGAQVLTLNLMGMGSQLSSNSTTLCKWHSSGFTDPDS